LKFLKPEIRLDNSDFRSFPCHQRINAMPEPLTPKIGCDSFVVNERNEVCLIRRADNGLWAMPGGYQDLGETPAECAAREFHEETGYQIRIVGLLGAFSSLRYPSKMNLTRNREITHLLFQGEPIPQAAAENSLGGPTAAEADMEDADGCETCDPAPQVSSPPAPDPNEVTEVAWFTEAQLPVLSDGHHSRLTFAFQFIALRKSKSMHSENPCQAHFE
jgi:ADP-ribose pyrophosphatase YjhB (NUDIX family)